LRRQPGLAVLRREDDVIEKVTIGGTHSGGGFRRPSSGALLFLNYIPGVPLRSPLRALIPTHPPGAIAGPSAPGFGR
jgi:hypothetical protein